MFETATVEKPCPAQEEVLATVENVIFRIPKPSLRMRILPQKLCWEYSAIIGEGKKICRIKYNCFGVEKYDLGREIAATLTIIRKRQRGCPDFLIKVRKESTILSTVRKKMLFYQRESEIPIGQTGIYIHFVDFTP